MQQSRGCEGEVTVGAGIRTGVRAQVLHKVLGRRVQALELGVRAQAVGA